MPMTQTTEMGSARLRFTIRSLMIAVAAIAGLLAVFTRWAEILPVLIVVGIPLAGLIGLLGGVPPQRPTWRLAILAVMLGWIILGCGWLWARSAIWIFQRQAGSVLPAGGAGAGYYEFWGLEIPMMVTGIGLVVDVLVLAIACVRRGLFGLVLLVVGDAFALALGWFLLFILLEFEAFD